MKKIILIITILLFLTSCNYNKTLIGSITENGKTYTSYKELFSLGCKPEGGQTFLFNNIYLVDEIDEAGYRVSYSYIGQILEDIYFYSDHTSPEEFDEILQRRVESMGRWHNNPYTNISEVDEFTCYFKFFNIIGTSPFNKSDKNYHYTLSTLFCYNDSLQFMISRYINADLPFGDEESQKDSGEYSERSLKKFTLIENLKIYDKMYEDGIPEPLTKKEFKSLQKMRKQNRK